MAQDLSNRSADAGADLGDRNSAVADDAGALQELLDRSLTTDQKQRLADLEQVLNSKQVGYSG